MGIMRTSLASVFVLAATMTAAAQPYAGRDRGRTRDDVDERGLNAEQIERYARVYYPGIRTCYLAYGQTAKTATGELKIKIVVHRSGSLFDVSFDAPGVRGAHFRRLDQCLRLQVLGWHFPVRRDVTTAILPYYFMKHAFPGPQYSCWKPQGCPVVPRSTRADRPQK
jgi:hypothetical protein